MKSLKVLISEEDYVKFGFTSDNLVFAELLYIVQTKLQKQTLDECIVTAEKYGPSEITMEDITKEVRIVRKNLKNR